MLRRFSAILIGVSAIAFVGLAIYITSSRDGSQDSVIPGPRSSSEASGERAEGQSSERITTNAEHLQPSLGNEHPTGLIVYFASDGRPAGETRWQLSNLEQTLEVTAGIDGLVGDLPAGTWKLEPIDSALLLGSDGCSIIEGQLTRVWCWQTRNLALRVTDESGYTLTGAQAEWRTELFRPQQYADVFRNIPESVLETSDDDGEVEFLRLPNVPGAVIVVQAKGFVPARIIVDDSAAESRKIQLTRLGDSQATILRVSGFDGIPMGGVSVRTIEHAMGLTDDAGTVVLGMEIGPQEVLRFSGNCFAGKARMSDILTSDREAAVRLPRRAAGALVVTPPMETRGKVRITSNLESRDQGAFTIDCVVEVDTGTDGKCSIDLPLEVPVLVMFVDAIGRMGVASLLIEAEGWVAIIETTSDQELRIRPSLAGEEVKECIATVHGILGEETSVSIGAAADGILHVPTADHVQLIRIRAPKAAETDLRPYGSMPRSGDLQLPLSPLVMAEVMVHTENPQLARGAEMSITALDSGITEYRDRGGMWPTTHPAWSRSMGNGKIVPIDSFGRGRVYLAEGNYSFVVRPWPWRRALLDAFPYETIAYVSQGMTAPIHIEIPGFVEVAVAVFDAATGLPVRKFEIRGPENGLIDEVDGHTWTGFVSPTTRRIDLLGSFGEHGTLVLDGGLGPSSHRVYLTDEGSMALGLSYEDGRPFTGTIFCSIMAFRSDVGSYQAGAFELEVADTGQTRLFVPHDYGVEVRLTARTHDGKRVRLNPEKLTWNGPGQASVVVYDK